MRVRTLVLRSLIISISLGALLGIIAILGGHLGEGALKVMITSFAIAITSVLVLPSVAAWQLPAARLWSRVGAAGTLASLAMLLAGMWIEIEGDSFWQTMLTVTVIGVTGAHGSLLTLA